MDKASVFEPSGVRGNVIADLLNVQQLRWVGRCASPSSPTRYGQTSLGLDRCKGCSGLGRVDRAGPGCVSAWAAMPDPDPGQPADKLSSASGESGASGEDSENEDGSTGSTRSTVLPGQGHDDWRSEDSTESTHSKNDDGEQAEGGKGPTLLPGQIALHDALDQGWSVGGKNKPADIALGGDEEESGEEEESEGSGEDEAESGEGDEEGSDEEEDASGQEDLDASHVERTSSNEDSNEDLDNESPRERGEVGNSAQPVSEKLRGKLPPIGAEDISVESFEDEGGKTDGYVEEEVVAAPAPKGDGTDALRSKRGQVVAEREGLEKLLDDLEQNQELTEEEEDKVAAHPALAPGPPRGVVRWGAARVVFCAKSSVVSASCLFLCPAPSGVPSRRATRATARGDVPRGVFSGTWACAPTSRTGLTVQPCSAQHPQP